MKSERINNTKTETRLIKVSSGGEKRLDIYLKDAVPVTRNRARAMIDGGRVFVNGEIQSKYHRLVRCGDDVQFDFQVKTGIEINPFEKELEVVYEGDNFIAVNKPAGMIVHPTGYGEQDTLVNAAANMKRGDTVHAINRLDRDTTGIVLLAFDKKKAAELAQLIKGRNIYKEYTCLVHGRVAGKGNINLEISNGGNGAKCRQAVETGGKSAATVYEPKENYKGATLLKVIIKTGRTHQIRAHMQFIKHQIIGDKTYGDPQLDEKLLGDNGPKRQLLHAGLMEFKLNKQLVSITAPLPEDFKSALEALSV
ncbi:MAG: RluA family pseudouridine synthase [Candidatus Goldbacteria bacterium]|nr:RluA family pseudouridine synthase [Candidatus Goldiibacteriota bacterium]